MILRRFLPRFYRTQTISLIIPPMRKVDLDWMGVLLGERHSASGGDESNTKALIINFNKSIQNGYKPSIERFRKLLEVSVQKRSVGSAEEILKCSNFMGHGPDAHIYCLLMDLYACQGNVEKVESLFGLVKKNCLSLDISLYNALLKALIFYVDLSKLESLFDLVTKTYSHVNENTYAVMIFAHAWRRDCGGAIKWFEVMQGITGDSAKYSPKVPISPTAITNQIVLYAYCRARDAPGAIAYLRSCQKKFTATHKMYEIIIHYYTLNHRPSQCADLFREMQRYGLEPTSKLYDSVIQVFFMHQNNVDGDAWLREMKACGFKPSANTFKSRIRYHLKLKESIEAIKVFEELIDEKLKVEQGTIIDLLCFITSIPFVHPSKYESEKNIDIDSTDAHVDRLWALFEPFRYKKSVKPTRMYHAILEYYLWRNDLINATKIFKAILKDNVLPGYDLAFQFSSQYVKTHGFANLVDLIANNVRKFDNSDIEVLPSLKLITEFGPCKEFDFEKTVPDLVDKFEWRKENITRLLETQILQFVNRYSFNSIHPALKPVDGLSGSLPSLRLLFKLDDLMDACWTIVQADSPEIKIADMAAFKAVMLKYCALYDLHIPAQYPRPLYP